MPGDVEALELAFRWDDEDFTKAWWIPQGLSGSADAYDDGRLEGRDVVLIGWWFAKELAMLSFDKGVRVSLVDFTDAPDLSLRHILLVEPVPGDPVDFKPVAIRAGSIAWYGDTLYLADPTQGLRVFDMSRLLAVNAGADKVGYDSNVNDWYGGLYSYVAMQVGAYKPASGCARASPPSPSIAAPARRSWSSASSATGSPPVTARSTAASSPGRSTRSPAACPPSSPGPARPPTPARARSRASPAARAPFTSRAAPRPATRARSTSSPPPAPASPTAGSTRPRQ
ncbi:hypothetical protein [Nannocystis pusilla]|uniref:hypothetical protein n=1 Tax=Nannocystis pusilla TaxID=889268 RepID=UPI003B7ED4B5